VQAFQPARLLRVAL